MNKPVPGLVCDDVCAAQEFPDCQESLFSCWLLFEWCGEGELRTPTHESRKSFFLTYLPSKFNLTG
jgi:hypothetical protein